VAKLTLEERNELEAECASRVQALAQQGAMIPGIGTRLIIELLSELLTVNQEAVAKERWLEWLTEQLDNAEAQVRQHLLASGLIGGNGRP
jgi:hypothetical protein